MNRLRNMNEVAGRGSVPRSTVKAREAAPFHAWAAYSTLVTGATREREATTRLMLLVMAFLDSVEASRVDWLEAEVAQIDARVSQMRTTARRTVEQALSAAPFSFAWSPEPDLEQAAENLNLLRAEIERLRGIGARSRGH